MTVHLSFCAPVSNDLHQSLLALNAKVGNFSANTESLTELTTDLDKISLQLLKISNACVVTPYQDASGNNLGYHVVGKEINLISRIASKSQATIRLLIATNSNWRIRFGQEVFNLSAEFFNFSNLCTNLQGYGSGFTLFNQKKFNSVYQVSNN